MRASAIPGDSQLHGRADKKPEVFSSGYIKQRDSPKPKASKNDILVDELGKNIFTRRLKTYKKV